MSTLDSDYSLTRTVDITPVVVVTHNPVETALHDCLAALAASTMPTEIVLVSNGLDISAFKTEHTHTIHLAENRGYGHAANAGIAFALSRGYERIALINDDITVTPNWLQPLHAYLNTSTNLGAVQPKLLVKGSNPSTINSLGVTLLPNGSGIDTGFGEIDSPAGQAARPIEIFSGGCVLFTRGFLTMTGGFDESYFLYYEDVDLAIRGSDLGWSYMCVPESTVYHAVEGTQVPVDRRHQHREQSRLRAAVRFGSATRVIRAYGRALVRIVRYPQPQLLAIAGAIRLLQLDSRFRRERKTRFPSDTQNANGQAPRA